MVLIISVSMLFTQYCTLTFDTNHESAHQCAIKESSLQKNARLSSIYNAFKKFFQSTVMSWGEEPINWAERMNAKGEVAEVLKHRTPIVLFPVWEWAGLLTSKCDGAHKVLPSKEAHLCLRVTLWDFITLPDCPYHWIHSQTELHCVINCSTLYHICYSRMGLRPQEKLKEETADMGHSLIICTVYCHSCSKTVKQPIFGIILLFLLLF